MNFYFNFYIIYQKKIIYLITIFLLLFFSSCSQKSEKDYILETIDKIGNYTENKNVDGIIKCISEKYSDIEGRTISDIRNLLKKYFKRYFGIVTNILKTKILEIKSSNAKIETDVAFSSGAAKVFRKVVRYSGELYRFTIFLKKENNIWKIRSVSWQYITIDELFPGSIKILKKNFPNTF